MTGDMIGAEQALAYGLVNYLADSEQGMLEKCRNILKKIFNKAPLAVGMVVSCVNAVYDPEQRGYETEANSFGNCCKTEDFHEGTTAFLEKRQPAFQGK